MKCAHCGTDNEVGNKFCGGCGRVTVDQAKPESPQAVLRYREALETFLADGPLEDWEITELSELRNELGVREETHMQLLSELSSRAVSAPSVSLSVDASTTKTFEVRSQCVLRFKVTNEGQRALRSAKLLVASSDKGITAEQQTRILGPGKDDLFTITFRPEVSGHHELRGLLITTDMLGAERAFTLRPITFMVARRDDGPQNTTVHIDASGLKVGTFDNLQVGQRSVQGGLVSQEDWQSVVLSAVTDSEKQNWLTSFSASIHTHGAISVSVVSTQAKAITVSPDGKGTFRTISEAVEQSPPGSKILVKPGQYQLASQVVINKNLQILGEGPADQVVFIGKNGPCFVVISVDVLLRSVTCVNAGDSSISALVTSVSGTLTLDECHVRPEKNQTSLVLLRALSNSKLIARRVTFRGGIEIANAEADFENCTIHSEMQRILGHGIWAHKNSRVYAKNTKINGTKKSSIWLQDARGVFDSCEILSSGQSGVNITGTKEGPNTSDSSQGTVTLTNCVINDHALNGIEASWPGHNVALNKVMAKHNRECGILVQKSGLVTASDSDFSNNARAGVGIAGQSRAVIRGSKLRANGTYAIHLHQGSAAVDGCDLTSNAQGAWLVGSGCTVQSSNNTE